jgi:hypothetical protein
VARPDIAGVELIERSMIDRRTADMLVGTVLAMSEHNFQEFELATRN